MVSVIVPLFIQSNTKNIYFPVQNWNRIFNYLFILVSPNKILLYLVYLYLACLSCFLQKIRLHLRRNYHVKDPTKSLQL